MPTFATPEPISVTLEPVAGNVRIVASDRTDTVVEVVPTDPSDASDVKAADQTRVGLTAGTLTVKAPRMNLFDFSNRTRSIDVTIELPAGSRIHGSTGIGDLHASGRLGEVRYKSGVGHLHLEHTGELNLHTATGNVVVEQVAGNAEVTSSSGRIQLTEIDGTAQVKNSNGHTVIGDVAGTVKVRAANGDITVERAGDSVDAKSANGSVRVNEAVRGVLELHTSMGDIEIGIRRGSAAWLDVSTRFGKVHNSMDAVESPDAALNKVEVRAQTAFGEITVRHS